ncbi:uncharacterized protein LOC125540419 [Triticum urartu]|uniref:uncharacterized protein LOC125540419 n=1 Tax=Triticum urartu TaxID=4572 RepID=UPI0020439435|nr:uncharacterized protein LOC125540419 [Triticum urartu]
MAAATRIPPTLPECNDYDGAILLDLRCYIADLPNATTASSATSRSLPIQVTFRAAPPPLLSHLCIHCPGLGLIFRHSVPRVVATDADLVLLRVPMNINASLDVQSWDYFVYRPRVHRLDLLPNPYPMCFRDNEAALLSREDGASYAVAAISSWCPVYEGDNKDSIIRWDFRLHLYRSSDSEGWITMPMSLQDLARDKLLPLPAAADTEDDDHMPLYHKASKTLAIGGKRGTVAWVDLWRGILLSDVLGERPMMVFQDIPLPMPARGNRGRFLRQCEPNYIRDVAITRHKDTIKFVEMEIWPPKKQTQQVIPAGWKATTWSMPIPALTVVGSFTADWQCDCEAQVGDVTGDPHHWNLLSKLSGSNITPTLQKVFTAYPIISTPKKAVDDDDIVYFAHSNNIGLLKRLELVIAVNVRNKTLRGVAEMDVQKKNFILMPVFCTSDICRHLRKTIAVSSQ